DIVTLAKPLSGGLVPIGATIARKEIVSSLLGGLDSKRHSTTFGGGGLATAVALRSLELLVQDNLVERSRQLGRRGLHRLRQLAQRYPELVRDVRAQGMLFAIELHDVVSARMLQGQRELLATMGGALALRALH